VARWGNVLVLLDDGGEVGELPGGVLELRPGSAGARVDRKVESHGEPITAATRSSGSSSGSQCKALDTQWTGRGASWW
jgi:hypothetical protein